MPRRKKKKRKILIFFFLCTFILAFIWFFVRTQPDVRILAKHYPQVIWNAQTKKTTIQFKKNRPKHWLGYSEVSSSAISAIVVSEDWSFFSHPGYDLQELRLVIWQTLTGRRRIRGASTLTQQLAKNLFLSNKKSLWRKMREIFLARDLEKHFSKEKILETYLNVVEFGPGMFGIVDASKTYFDKHPSELNAKEGAFLAYLLPNPKKYSRSFRDQKLTEHAHKIVQEILRKMHKGKYITQEELDFFNETPLSFEQKYEALDWVIEMEEAF